MGNSFGEHGPDLLPRYLGLRTVFARTCIHNSYDNGTHIPSLRGLTRSYLIDHDDCHISRQHSFRVPSRGEANPQNQACRHQIHIFLTCWHQRGWLARRPGSQKLSRLVFRYKTASKRPSAIRTSLQQVSLRLSSSNDGTYSKRLRMIYLGVDSRAKDCKGILSSVES